jgi:ubiquinone/menaquinone biosynthesis C-methylase UbiE
MKTLLRKIKNKIPFPFKKKPPLKPLLNPNRQDLDLYWNQAYAQVLETWGEGNVWDEIQLLMVNCKGKVLDIACGTGRTIEILSGIREVEIHGFDISDFLISKAIERGISKNQLSVCDATQMDFADDIFDYAYSIGSLEHFTEDGISKFLTECYRVTKFNSFHQIPVSRSGKNEGWIKTVQTYHNNSVDWWLDKFKASYNTVYVLDSKWEDGISVGKWFVCIKDIK